MSDSFHDREKSYEAKYKLDAELRFKAESRRDKYVGLWAAEKMGMSGADAEAYAKTVVMADLEEPGYEDVVRKVMADFTERSVSVSEDEVRQQLEAQMIKAIEEVKGEFEPLGPDHN